MEAHLNLAKHRGFNLIGFKDKNTGDHDPYLHCPIHIGRVLIKDPKDSSVLICPDCGLSFEETELTHETTPTSKFGKPNKGPMLLQPNKKKRLRAEDGSPIPEDDTIAINDLQQGRRVLKYHEHKIEK
jgi:hypothetical protein